MKNSTLLRLLCLAVFAALASFGAFNFTAQPAYALMCPETFLGCPFDHVQESSNARCCIYLCGSRYRTGPCEQI